MRSGLGETSQINDPRAELALAQKLAKIGMWRWDLRANTLEWSEEAFRIFRWPKERGEPHPDDFHLLFSPASAVDAETAGRRALEGGAPYEVDLQLAGDADAPWIVAMIQAAKDPEGKVIGLRGIVQDITRRKQAEQRRRFQAALLDAVGQAVIATDPAGRIVYWNAGAEKLYGWSRAEAIGRDVSEMTPSDISRDEATIILKELAAGKSWTGDFVLRRKDGSNFIGEVRDDPVLDENGRLIGIIGVSVDISEKRAAESEQRRLLEELDLAQSIAHLGSWSVDTRTGNVTWSAEMYSLMRRDRALGPTRGDEGFSSFTPESAARLREAFLKAQQGHAFDIELERADNRAWFVAQGEAVLENGSVVGTRGILRDITRERNVREALRASERRLLEAQTAARIGYWEYDLASGAILWSRQMYELTARDRATGAPTFVEVLSLLTEQSAATLAAAVERTRADGTPYALDLELRENCHGCRYIAATGRAVRDENAHIIGLRGTAQDITARRQAQDVLLRAERLTTLGTLVAGVAHEINNPLTYIRGNIEIIQSLTPDPQVQSAARTALEGLDRIGAITRGLRMVTRPTTGTRMDTDVNKLVHDILPVARPRLGTDVELKLELQATRRVAIDATQVGQVLINLLFNAGDALGDHAEGRVVVSTKDDEDGVTITISDNGPGMPPEIEQRLFAPFFTTKPEGTGLGLSVSQAIVKAHEGTLTVQTRAGTGTTFLLHLPAQEHPRVTP